MNIFLALWNLIKSFFKRNPKQTLPIIQPNPITPQTKILSDNKVSVSALEARKPIYIQDSNNQIVQVEVVCVGGDQCPDCSCPYCFCNKITKDRQYTICVECKSIWQTRVSNFNNN